MCTTPRETWDFISMLKTLAGPLFLSVAGPGKVWNPGMALAGSCPGCCCQSFGVSATVLPWSNQH